MGIILLVLLVLVLVVSAGIFIFTKTAPQFGAQVTGERLEQIKQSPHYSNDEFQNLVETKMDMDFMGFLSISKEFFFSKDRAPKKPLETALNDEDRKHQGSGVFVTWYGHSALFLEMEGMRMMVRGEE